MTEKGAKLLVVEDDAGLQKQLKWAFEDFDTMIAGDRGEALTIFRAEVPPVVTLDLGLPPDPDGTSEGFQLIEEILSLAPETKVIVASGHGERASALRAIAMGAYDFYQKPIDADELLLIVKRALNLYELERENRRLLEREDRSPLEAIITGSDTMIDVCRMIEKVAPTDASVLLLGASGTGKELLARGLHGFSSRKKNSFIAINCAAIPENLLESELFGYEKGAFTGAVKQTVGKIELAQGGTLFLDEVGDLPLALQVKLLRFIQERAIERVGGRREIPVDVRIVCATHQDLEQLIKEERFREDLYYRIAEITVTIPPLKDREGDAALLAKSFLAKYSDQLGKRLTGFTPDAIAAINSYSWPGNVRELENKIKRAVILAEGRRAAVGDLDLRVREGDELVLNLKKVREKADRTAIRKALAQTGSNISQCAKLLGISRPTFYDLLKQYDIKP